ncbi:MAG TPA: hypothetical protein VIT24_14540 [Acidimicrobiales bacterium]
MNFRRLVPLLAVPFLLGACGGDDGGSNGSVGDAGSTSITTPSETTAAPGTVAGPSAGESCSDLAERYVRRARTMFDREGTPPDALVDRVRARLVEFDQIAATAGCGEEYVTGVCEGLDALTQEGLLVIIPLTTAQCL